MRKFNMPHPAASALRRCSLLLFLLLALSACSSLRLAYNNGDTLLYWWLDGYVDLNSSQKSRVKTDIDKLFQWHRSTQLHDYAQLLQASQQHLNGNTDSAHLRASYDEVKQRSQVVLLQAVPELADLLRSLRPEQVATLEKKFAANNAEFRDKYLQGDIQTQQKLRYKKTLEQLELWFGDFSDAQEAQIRKASDARPLINALWLEQRLHRQQEILALVRKVQHDKPDRETTMALLRSLIVDAFRQQENAARGADFEAYEEATAQMVLTVIRLSTAAQKAHAKQRMQGWIRDLNRLAQEAR